MSVYDPYRSELLSKAQLRELNELRPWIAVKDTFISWTIIVACWAYVYFFTHWYNVLLVIPIIGCQLYALMILAHDGLHRRLFSTIKMNDLWCDVFLLGPILAVTRINRNNHINHHQRLSTPQDPDRYKYQSTNKSTVIDLFLFLTGVSTFFKTIYNVFFAKRKSTGQVKKEQGYSLANLLIVILWQILLLGGLTWFFGWWGYIALFAFPFYVFAYLADTIRVFCEHSQPEIDTEETDKKRLITVTSNWLERQFFAPHNMNLHMPHHLWPSIPYYNLPEADRLIQKSPLRDDRLIWRNSYIEYILTYLKWLLQNKQKIENHA